MESQSHSPPSRKPQRRSRVGGGSPQRPEGERPIEKTPGAARLELGSAQRPEGERPLEKTLAAGPLAAGPLAAGPAGLLALISEFARTLVAEENASAHTVRNYVSDLRQLHAF